MNYKFLVLNRRKKKKRFLIVVQYALFKYCKYVLFRLSAKVWNTWCINHKMLIDWVLSGQTGNRPSNSVITYVIISRSRSVLLETTLDAMHEGFFQVSNEFFFRTNPATRVESWKLYFIEDIHNQHSQDALQRSRANSPWPNEGNR